MSLTIQTAKSLRGNEESLVQFNIEHLKGKFLANEPLARYTTWRVGGIADYYFKPVDIEDLAMLLKQVPEDMSVSWIGKGSNLLIRDGGIRGLVISLGAGFEQIQQLDSKRWLIGAGAACARVAKSITAKGFKGAEFLIGIPGTIGGALAMNAGAYKGEMWQLVNSVKTVNKSGELFQRDKKDYEIAYRSVKGVKDEWFLACELELEQYKEDESVIDLKELLAKRSATQPLGQASCGSVFRNPENDFAARLIEESGLKGHRIGGAVVSEKHANFIINNGDASAKDIEDLIKYVQAEVQSNYGIKLFPEAKIFGEYANGVDGNE